MRTEIPIDAGSTTGSYLEQILLGVVQGLTEFLPVSSSGHLVALERFFGRGGHASLTTEILLHFATLLAVIIVFRSDLMQLLRGAAAGGADRLRIWQVGVACVPAGVVGLLAHDEIARLPDRLPFLIPACWIVMALVLFSLRRVTVDGAGAALGWSTALIIGLAQAVAILPGISRSGLTIAVALWLGVGRQQAASFSFLAAIPIILGATVMQVIEVLGNGDGQLLSLPLLVGGLTAFATGILALHWLLGSLRRGQLHRWGYYLLAIGIGYGFWVAR